MPKGVPVSPVGLYPITPKCAKDVNYTVTFVNGTRLITH